MKLYQHPANPVPEIELLTVRDEPAVTETLEAAIAEFAMAEDIYEAAKDFVSRKPDVGEAVPNTDPVRRVVFLPPVRLGQRPGLLVRFRVEPNLVVVEWIRFYPYDEATAVMPDAYTI